MGAFQNLGQALRWLRTRQNRKQYQIAEAAGITKAMLSAYETGKQKPSLETLEKILDALGKNLADLHHSLHLHQGGRPGELPADGGDAWENAPRGRAGDAWSETPVNVYRALGLDHRLPADQERSLAQMLQGFHGLLRHMAQQLDRPANAPLGPRRIETPPAPGGDEEE